jgi:hypothetical protein
VSVILDALRRGRGHQLPRAHHHPAQTDAVLETLGSTRFKAASPVSRFKRSAGLFLGGVLAILALWGVVIWLT